MKEEKLQPICGLDTVSLRKRKGEENSYNIEGVLLDKGVIPNLLFNSSNSILGGKYIDSY